jgi:hypothetical protein
MKDELEDFIRQNKSSFDDKEPSGRVWDNIRRSIFFSRRGLWNSTAMWRAAAIIFMAFSAYLMIPKGQIGAGSTLALKEFNDVEAFYFAQISQKVELIDGFKKSEGLNGFTHDFQQLEAMYLVLKEELKKHPSTQVKDALVLNLLVRIDLLNQQLHKLEEGYPDESKKEESEANT